MINNGLHFLFCHVGNYVYYCNWVLALCGGGNGLGTNVFVRICAGVCGAWIAWVLLTICFSDHRLGGLRR